MEEKISNTIFRKFVLKSIFNIENKDEDLELDEGSYLWFVSKKLERLKELNDVCLSIYNAIVTTVFLDAYKILNAKVQESTISFDEKRFYDLIASILNFDSLENALFSYSTLLEELLKYALEFYRSSILRKITVMKKLTEGQKQCLKTGFSLFENDIEEYENHFSLETLINYYQEEIKKYEEAEIGIKDFGTLTEDLLEEISGFIKMLAGYDPASFEELMEELLETDYKWSKYIIDHSFKIQGIDLEENEQRVKFFESFKIKDLIYDEILYNDDYLKSTLNFILEVKINKIIKEEIIEEYYDRIRKR